MRNGIIPAVALVFGVMVQSVAIAFPLNEYEQFVDDQLYAALEEMRGVGYTSSLPRTVNAIAPGAEAPQSVLMNPGWDYAIVAVCDQRCDNVDLVIRDQAGNEVASDLSPSGRAFIEFAPPEQAVYQITVRMVDCSSDSCNFGLGIFISSFR